MLWPHEQLESIQDITPAFLLSRGLKALLLDLDNTLVAYKDTRNNPALLAWVAQMRQSGCAMRIVSNGTPQCIAHWSARLDVPSIGVSGAGFAAKPWPFAFQNALRDLQRDVACTPKEIGMVGDQVFSDVLGGNLQGLHTILVKPISEKSFFTTRWVRQLERLILRLNPHNTAGVTRHQGGK